YFFLDFVRGTFPPARRASDSPIAIACFRLVTFFPERPLFKVPLFCSRIALLNGLAVIALLFPNSSPPGAGFLTPILDELFESFEITFHPTRNHPQRVTSFFDETFWLIGELKTNLRAIWTSR